MAKLAIIREQIRLIEEIQHVTRTMKTISAVRWRMGKGTVDKINSFASKLESILEAVSFCFPSAPPGDILVLGVFSDKGLVGNFNQLLAYKIDTFISTQEKDKVKLAILGSQGKNLLSGELMFFQELPVHQLPHYWDVRDLVYKIEELRREGKFTHLYLAFNRYISVSQHQAEVIPVLPLSAQDKYSKEIQDKYIFLSDVKLLAERLSFEYLFASIYRAIVESFISEQAARLTIMDAATTHAQDMIESLTTSYHKMRQEQITQELNEVSSAYQILGR
ncbi:MAG: F-type H+-transporting ATPase subunit gamma [Candidatus Atribacteria bacterium]|nr:F-type H+-transporting ATPase subunit gamma [Candidatus Atribacteria bacterium]